MTHRRHAPDALGKAYVAAAAVFTLLAAAVVFLVGQFATKTLSQRYMDDLLTAGGITARKLAKEMEQEDGDIYKVVEKATESLIWHGTQLAERKLYKKMLVLDQKGNVVWEATLSASQVVPQKLAGNSEAQATQVDISSEPRVQTSRSERAWEVRAPIRDLGELVLVMNRDELASRVEALTSELRTRFGVTAAATVLTLFCGFALIWFLIQRNRKLESERQRDRELADLGVMAAQLAHEIRNPLNSVSLNLELAQEEGGEAVKEELDAAKREVVRLAHLVEEFLRFARPSKPKPSPVDICALLDELAVFLKPETTDGGITLRVEKCDGQPVAMADPGQLRQVLVNLVMNAKEAVRELHPERRVVELGATTLRDEVKIWVRDRGHGVDSTILEKLTEPFFTTRASGTGLGLAVCRRIVAAHGGRLELKNLEPEGFEAAVVLPAATVGVKMNAGRMR